MRYIILLLFLCTLTRTSAQSRGAIPIHDLKAPKIVNGRTYAVVIGISKYKNITGLKFADRDARAFADWLLSPYGGATNKDDIKLLTNEAATQAAIGDAFYWLLGNVKSGDKAYIYFAGHGDVESKDPSEPGYLLCYDVSDHTYSGGGAFDLVALQRVISGIVTLTENSQLIVIMDACHAGKLAGNKINGNQLTLENTLFSAVYKNVTKILSCEPNQVSYEDSKFGTGRGIFSYSLMQGLSGLADADDNGKITNAELESFVTERIAKMLSPVSQTPVFVFGPKKSENFASYDIKTKDSIDIVEKPDYSSLSPLEGRTNNMVPLLLHDTIYLPSYTLFYARIKENKLLEPANDCAEYYYNVLINNVPDTNLHNELKRNFAFALQESSQAVIGDYINCLPGGINSKSSKEMSEIYEPLPKMLTKAADLLGPHHFFYNQLMSNAYLFKGLIIQAIKVSYGSKETEAEKIQFYKKSLSYNSNNPIALMNLSNSYAYNYHNLDSCTYYFNKAITATPVWSLPYAYYGYNLSRYFDDTDSLAKVVLEHGMQLDSQNVFLLYALGSVYFYQEEYIKCVEIYKQSILLDTTNSLTWLNLAISYQMIKNYISAETAFEKSIELNANQLTVFLYYGYMCYLNKDLNKAEKLYLKGIENNLNDPVIRSRLCLVYLDQNEYDLVEKQCVGMLKNNIEDWRVPFNRACIAALKGQKKLMLKLLLETSEKDQDGEINADYLKGLTYFKNYLSDKKFNALLESNFKVEIE